MPTAKHALLTGGSSGIGKATARVLLDRDWRVSNLALEDSDLAATAQAFSANPAHQVYALGADLTERDATHAAVAHCVAVFGPVDALITSAGIAKPARSALWSRHS